MYKFKIFILCQRLLFLSILYFSCNQVLAEKEFIVKLSSKENSIYLDLLKQANEINLYQDPYWLKLLHFYSFGESIGQWSSKSDVVSESFFLSYKGGKDPQEELKATLKALISNQIVEPDKHARCKFIARFKWLKTKINFPKLSELNCPLFERWANLKDSKGISLVFVSAYLKNPASTFGHLLLKFNSKDSLFGHSLLRPTMNFGAKIHPDENPFIYALNGLFGGYKGIFTDERFYNFNHVYGENELRDLWEYPLNFNEKQRNRIIYHAWELLHNVEFTYYFFLDNCAYRMAELLEMAWDDDKRINTSGAMWAIPVDVLFKLRKINLGTKNKSLVDSPNLIMSRQRKLQKRVSLLNESERFQLKSLIEDLNYLESEKFLSLEETSKSKIIDASLDHHQYMRSEELNPKKEKGYEKLLIARSKLPILESDESDEIPKSPIDGTPPMRFRLGSVLNDHFGSALELGVWANYHDLLGEEIGHIENAEVVTLDLQMQIREDSFDVTQFQLFNIQKYALNPTGIPGDYELSWRARAVWERETYGCLDCRVFRTSGGLGRSFSLTRRDLEYAFLEMFFEAPVDSFYLSSFGLAPQIGFTWSAIDLWKMNFQVGWFKSFYGINKEYFRWIIDQRFTISQNSDFRFEIEHFEELEGIFALNYYW